MTTNPCSLVLAAALGACSPPTDDTVLSDDTMEDTRDEALSDLSLQVTLAGADALNPHGDGSGVILLHAAAEDAVEYVFAVDGAEPISSASGEVEVTVEQEGTHAYTLTVTATDASGETATRTETAEVYRSTERFRTLIWADEFEGDGAIDAEKWHHQVQPPEGGGWYNGELQHYTDRTDNAIVSDGTLKIVARREAYTTEGSTRGYTSARLNSRLAFTYGRVEVRAKLPAAAGTWPAIWTLGANVDEIGNVFGDTYGSVGWPACGEIDIMEQRGWDKDTTLAYFHWGDTATGAYASEGADVDNPASTTDFHVYALTWTEDSLDVFVDDTLVYSLQNTAERPYDDPHYLLLNVAMGGNLGGTVPDSFTQATMEIDYVRVYQ